MKKINIILSASILIALSSCKKTYSCDCITNLTLTAAATGGSPATIAYPATSKPYSEKMNEKQAKSACAHEAVSIKSGFDDNINKSGYNGKIITNTNCTVK